MSGVIGYRLETRFVVKELNEDGLLKDPIQIGYGSDQELFSEYQTLLEAEKAVKELGGKGAEYVIIRLARKTVEYED